MNNVKKGLTVAYLLLTGITALGQIDLMFVGADKQYLGEFVPIRRELNYNEIVGTPYANPNLMKGSVIWKSGDTSEYYLRYNIYADEMEYISVEESGNQLKVILNLFEINRIFLNRNIYVYRDHYLGSRIDKNFFIEMVNGPCSLYRKMDVSFHMVKSPASSYDKAVPATFKRDKDQWMISFDGAPAQLVSFKKNVLKNTFEDNLDQLEKYADDNNLKPRKIDDFIEIVKYYNTLSMN